MKSENSRFEKDPLRSIRDKVERASHGYDRLSAELDIADRVHNLLIERCEPFVSGTDVLELGYVDGAWTDAILRNRRNVDIVEGARRHVERAEARYRGDPNVRVFHWLFEEFTPDRRYDTVVAGGILGCVEDPLAFLRRVRGWLKEGGYLIATLPNTRSLHRRIGTLMNFEDTPDELGFQYQEVGVVHAFDRYKFRTLLLESGFEVMALRGCFLKPVPNELMENWDDRLLRALLEVGDELEDYCYYMYAICRKPESSAEPFRLP